MYVIVRNNLSYPQKCVQSCHAAIEAARELLSPDQEHPHLVITVVKNEAKLKRLAETLTEKNIKHKIFIEPDIGHQVTAIATAPISGKDREMFRHYQLLME